MRAFYEPVALTAFETDDVASALKTLHHLKGLRWHRAPSGIQPDVYLSHLRSIDLQEDAPESSLQIEQEGQQYGQSNSQHQQRVLLDADGCYKNRPICLLGEYDEDHFIWRFDGQPEKAQALQQMLQQAVGNELYTTCIEFILTQQLIRMRDTWKNSHLIWTDANSQIYLAVASPRKHTIWWHPQATLQQIKQAQTHCIPYEEKLDFDSTSYHSLTLQQALWSHAQRGRTSRMHSTLIERHLHDFVRLHHHMHLPKNDVGHAARYVVRRLGKAPESIHNLLQQPLFSKDEMLRALVALLLTRVITFGQTVSAASTV